MLRDARTPVLAALVACAIACTATQALTRRPTRADPLRMTPPSALDQIITRAVDDLQPGALVALNALPQGRRLVDVVTFDPAQGTGALQALDVHHDDMPLVITLGQVLRGYTIVQLAPSIPNVLSDADLALLRVRVDQRGT